MTLEDIHLKLTQRWNREYTLTEEDDSDYVKIAVDLKRGERIIDFLPKSYWEWICGLGKLDDSTCYIPVDFVNDFHDNYPFTSNQIQILNKYCHFQIQDSNILIHNFSDRVGNFPLIYRRFFIIQDDRNVIMSFKYLDVITEHLSTSFPLELPSKSSWKSRLFEFLLLKESG